MNRNFIALQIIIIIFLTSIFFAINGYINILYVVGETLSKVKTIPDNRLIISKNFGSTYLYDSSGNIKLMELYGENRHIPIKIDDISLKTQLLFLQSEDRKFYSHDGLDLKGITRAILENIKAGKTVQGGSTITQQLIKLYFLSPDRTWKRKLSEAILALKLESRYSKKEILEQYLNIVPVGSNWVGIGTGANGYYKKDVKDLTLKESAYLAVIIRSPSYLDPLGPYKDELDKRANLLLMDALKDGIISQDDYNKAIAQEIDFTKYYTKMKYPYFSMYTRQYLIDHFGPQFLERGGFKIYTTIDTKMQDTVERILKEQEGKIKSIGATDVGAVVLDRNSNIKVMVGGLNWEKSQYNLTTAKRAQGSSVKPLVFACLFDKKPQYGPDSLVNDRRKDFGGGYNPTNYDEWYQGGWMTIRTSLLKSLNIPAVRAGETLGYYNLMDCLINKFQIKTMSMDGNYGLPVAIGAGDWTLLGNTNAYNIINIGGYKREPNPILRIEDFNGNIIADYSSQENVRVISKEATVKVIDIIKDTSRWQNHKYNFEVAIKTGTSDGPKDLTTLGFSHTYTMGIWVGRKDNKNLFNWVSSRIIPLPIWHSIFTEINKGVQNLPLPSYKGLDKETIPD